MTAEEPLAYTVAETADALAISEGSVRKLLRLGLLPSFTRLDKLWIPVTGIRDYLEQAACRSRP